MNGKDWVLRQILTHKPRPDSIPIEEYDRLVKDYMERTVDLIRLADEALKAEKVSVAEFKRRMTPGLKCVYRSIMGANVVTQDRVVSKVRSSDIVFFKDTGEKTYLQLQGLKVSKAKDTYYILCDDMPFSVISYICE